MANLVNFEINCVEFELIGIFQCNNNLLIDADCVANVKQLYRELHFPEKFDDYKKRNRENVMRQIDQLLHSNETLRNACINFFGQGCE